MNKCIFVGNLTRDPELSTTGSGIAYCRFAIAVSRTYANANGEREADFINIVVWRGLAENCGKYLKKGSKVAICGQLQSRSYDGNDGTKKYVTEIIADEVEFLRTGGAQDRPQENVEESAKTVKKPAGGGILTPAPDETFPF